MAGPGYCPKCYGKMRLRPNGRIRTCESCGFEEKAINQPRDDAKFVDVDEIIS